MKKIRALCVVTVLISLVSFALVGATSTSTTTTVKDGKKITTKVKTDNAGITTTTVTIKDKDDTVTTTTTVTDKDGNILSTDDPEARAKAEAAKTTRQERQAALASAPKRGPNDPIHVALFQTVVSEDLRKATANNGGVFPYLRKEFDHDPVITALEQRDVDPYEKDYDFRTGVYKNFSSFNRGTEFLAADVYVESFAKLEEKVGISKTTNKLASAPFLVYTATITSEYGDRPLEVTEQGFILANVEVTRKFAEKIKAAVRDEIGSTIPRDAARFRRGTEGMTGERINASEALRNLFKKK